MSTKRSGPIHEGLYAIIDAIPDGTYYSVDHERVVSMQATSQERVAAIQSAFPGVWHMEWKTGVEWWEYAMTRPDGWTLRIYAVTEAPAGYAPIIEPVTRVESVPVTWDKIEVTTNRVIGYTAGHQPTETLDTSNPPQGGSGVPKKGETR